MLVRCLSRDVVKYQLRQLHQPYRSITRSSWSQQLPIRVAGHSRTGLNTRCYANTATKPSRTVKAAVKRTARKSPTSKASKKATSKSTTSKKAKKVTKVKRVKKAVVKPKKKPVKPKSEKAKALDLKTKQLKHVKELVSLTLTIPKAKPQTAWTILSSEMIKDPREGQSNIAQAMKTASEKYKNLSPAEREHYNHIANQNKAENEAEYKAWIEQYTPTQIRQANNARLLLGRMKRAKKVVRSIPANLKPIKDERRVKLARSAWTFFCSERRSSGDFKDISVTDASKLLAEEWKALTDSEKQKYTVLAQEDVERYKTEHEKVYQYPVGAGNAWVS